MRIQVRVSSLVLLLLLSTGALWSAATLRDMVIAALRMEKSGEWLSNG
jgi:hypothetical protein